MITTTLNKIMEQEPLGKSWKALLAHLGKTESDDAPLSFTDIVCANGLDDALWFCQSEPDHDKSWRIFAVQCAREVQSLMCDQVSKDALTVSERFANGTATAEEIASAWAEARRAARAVDPTDRAAVEAAWAAAWAAAGRAAEAAETAAAALAAAAETEEASELAWSSAKKSQRVKFLDLVGCANPEQVEHKSVIFSKP